MRCDAARLRYIRCPIHRVLIPSVCVWPCAYVRAWSCVRLCLCATLSCQYFYAELNNNTKYVCPFVQLSELPTISTNTFFTIAANHLGKLFNIYKKTALALRTPFFERP
jgi:hypothetical protein